MLVFRAMRKIDKLICASIIPPFLIALAVLTFVAFMNELGRLSELLITGNASPKIVLFILTTLAPRVLIFTIPLSFLIGTLIGLSGLSGEHQITALRACGVSLRRLLKPVLMVALAAGLLTALMSTIILPRTNNLLVDLKDLVSIRQATSMIMPRTFNEKFESIVFYFDDISVDRQHYDRIFLADNSNRDAPKILMSRQGAWVTDEQNNRQLQLHLEQGTIYEVSRQDPNRDNISYFSSTDIPISLKVAGGQENTGSVKARNPNSMSTLSLLAGTPNPTPVQRREEMVELSSRLALPCSVFGFALIALSLGICARRGGRTAGSALSLMITLIYYVTFMQGVKFAKLGTAPIWLGVWAADLVLLAAGIILLISAEQNSRLAQCAAEWQWRIRFEILVRRLHLVTIKTAFLKFDRLAISSTGSFVRSIFPKVLDSYIYRGFLTYFLWSVAVCYTLFVILTLFDLLDEIISQRIPATVVIEYFLFLTPHILLLIVPMALLLASLILFGILEKGSEVTAMKAGGWSLYRIALPVFLMATLFCAGIYFMQDYLLPRANIQQDMIRNQIKGRPAQTSGSQRKWILGKSNRIYNYDFFDQTKDVFVGLNVYDVDFQQHTIARRIFAKRAIIMKNGSWMLEDGWVRDFEPGHRGFEPIQKARFDFPEQSEYFKKEIFEPKESAKRTYWELKNYIDYLKQSGYNATELQVQLHMKISFPLSCLVMALLGVPFSFFMGKKGAFFGITSSIAIAICYWGIFRIFEQLGAYGMLAPMLAAWAPNLLFGVAGLVMLLTIRT
jgi:LPS export ABC transporter permease LptG/LPS export ABC transporter permease LptF